MISVRGSSKAINRISVRRTRKSRRGGENLVSSAAYTMGGGRV
jgi:hypothetical protein